MSNKSKSEVQSNTLSEQATNDNHNGREKSPKLRQIDPSKTIKYHQDGADSS